MNELKNKILVLDADHKNALAIVRHLGKTKKFTIDTIGYSKASICFFSKFINKKYIVPNPKNDRSGFIEEVLKILKTNNYLTVIPVSYLTFDIFAEYKSEIEKLTHITITEKDNIKTASNKILTYRLAEKLSIPYPKTFILKNISEVENLEISYPCVIKAPLEMGKNLVEYALSKKDMIKKFKKMISDNDFKNHLPVIQEYIRGEGVGFFAFYKDGKLINYFMHRRIREYPVSGGASTVAESFSNRYIYNYGKKILDYLNWNGVAMVEFKKDIQSNEYKLMEINAKFWGSLELAIVAGVNFPMMLIDNALGKEIKKIDSYPKVKFQWVLSGDIFHIIENPRNIFAFIKDLFTSKNDIWLSDIKPNLFQLLYIPRYYYKKRFK